MCLSLMNADDYYPPSLKRTHTPKVALPGEWFSERCETRPNGMFLTRRLLFKDDGKSWEGHYYHYVDALCRQPTFTIYAAGTYVSGALSGQVGRSYDFDFKVLKVKITPGDRQIVKRLNGDEEAKCGVKDGWEIGVEQDVTWTHGCEGLGIRVPHVEYEILRYEKDHHRSLLYLGQRPSDGSHPSTPQQRPTSFQSPMVKCDKPITVTPPIVRRYDHQRTSGAPWPSASVPMWLASAIALTLLVSARFSGA